jgi:predicted nucleotidyltransferase
VAGIDPIAQKRALLAREIVSRTARVDRAYIFGSHATGTADRWSDIDVALFVVGAEDWDLHFRARLAAQVQKEAGDEVEPHFFPAKGLDHSDPAGFAAWIIRHGVELRQ